MDYSTLTLADLRAELDKQAGISEAAARARSAVADEIRRRDAVTKASVDVSALTDAQCEALQVALAQRAVSVTATRLA